MPGNVSFDAFFPDSTSAIFPASVSDGPESGVLERSGDALALVRVPYFLDLRTEMLRYEATLIRTMLQRCQGNQTRAAKLLCLPRRTLVYKLSALRKAAF